MKTVKITLYTIIVLSVVFFGTGLIIKETNYETKVEINKPLSETFTLFNKISNMTEWIPEIQSIEVVNEKPGKIGSTYKVTVENAGQEIVMQQKVLAYVENEKVTLYFDAENMLKTDDYIFTTEGNTTVVTHQSKCTSESYITSCIFPYFKGRLKKIDQGYLNNFKAFAEKQ